MFSVVGSQMCVPAARATRVLEGAIVISCKVSSSWCDVDVYGGGLYMMERLKEGMTASIYRKP